MADGRIFTDYRPNCDTVPSGQWSEYNHRRGLQSTGVLQIQTDRSLAAMAAGHAGCVDTMVPELNKRVYTWQGGAQVVSQAVGIGTGRFYLPGQPELLNADPDVVAAATIPDSMLPGTFQPNPFLYAPAMTIPSVAGPVVPARRNRYSAPYGF
jgi:hypothetical protein